MRRLFVFACVSATLAAAAACATSRDDAAPDVDGGGPASNDAAVEDAGREASTPKGPASCSDAGWCVTPLPDSSLTVVDIWPLESHAFAVVTSGELGVKVMEWSEADRRWTYIDDNTQNDDGFGKYVGRIWAPSDSEVYYTVARGYVYHGTRAGAGWTWARSPIAIDVPPDPNSPGNDPAASISPESAALGVWGTSANDVYAWHANTIFHLQSVEGGPPEWVIVYAGPASPPADRLKIFSAGGSGKDDVWFGAASGFAGCPVLIKKTGESYRHVVDGLGSYGPNGIECKARPDALLLDAKVGRLTDIQPIAGGGVVALRAPDTVARITPSSDGGYVVAAALFPSDNPYKRKQFYSLWTNGDDAWLSGPGLILRGPFTGDTNAYGISSVALTGSPLDASLYRVRGTGNNNLWAIGPRYALHKTTP